MNEKKRCFIAVNLPAELKKEIFEKLSKKIPARECKAVERENLHITMLFLGYLNSGEIAAAKEKILSLTLPEAFDAELQGIGSFNSRVFWIGVKKGEKELVEIAKVLQEIFKMREEKFSAHLTIARNKFLRGNEAEALVKKLNGENFSGKFKAESVDFMESVLSRQGPKYEKLFSAKLKQG